MGKIRADIDKLGLGEAEMHDLYGVPLALAQGLRSARPRSDAQGVAQLI